MLGCPPRCHHPASCIDIVKLGLSCHISSPSVTVKLDESDHRSKLPFITYVRTEEVASAFFMAALEGSHVVLPWTKFSPISGHHCEIAPNQVSDCICPHSEDINREALFLHSCHLRSVRGFETRKLHLQRGAGSSVSLWLPLCACSKTLTGAESCLDCPQTLLTSLHRRGSSFLFFYWNSIFFHCWVNFILPSRERDVSTLPL